MPRHDPAQYGTAAAHAAVPAAHAAALVAASAVLRWFAVRLPRRR